MSVSDELEFNVLRELIQLYRHQSCLWDTKSTEYRCTRKKNMAWGILLAKFKEIDPNADITSVKRKIDNMKACYQRELRKVNKSLLECKSRDDIHEPSLWYYKLFSFLHKKELNIDPENYEEFINKKRQYSQEPDQTFDEQGNDGVYMLIVDNYYDPITTTQTKTELPKKFCSNEKQKEITHYTKELKRSMQNTRRDQETTKANKLNPFAMYIGKQLEEMSAYQRKVAEKVISEVIFLGKTDSLSLHSRVESTPVTPHIPQFPDRCTIREESMVSNKRMSAKRKISPKPRSVKTKTIRIAKSKCKMESQLDKAECDDSSTLLVSMPNDPLSATDCSSDSDTSIFETPSNYDDSSNSTMSEVQFKNEDMITIEDNIDKDTTINEDDSILMTLLKTK